MKNVIIFEVLRALKKKSFWVASILPLMIILAVFGIEFFSINSAKTPSGAGATSRNATVAVFDASGLVSPSLIAADHIATAPTKEAGISAVVSGKWGAFIYYPADVGSSGIQVYSQDAGIGITPYNALAVSLLERSVAAKVSAAVSSTQAVRILEHAPSVIVTTYRNGTQTPGVASAIAPGLFAAAFLLLVILLTPFMLLSTSEEKENRAAEILLTSIDAGKLIGGKIVSILVLGIVQIAIIVVPVVLIALRYPELVPGISFGAIPLDPVAITIGALFLAAGLALFTGLAMGVGSIVPGINTANRYVGVFIIWVFVPIWMIALVTTSPNAAAVTALTYFPLTAPTTVLLRNALGSLPLGEAALAFAIVAASAVFAIWFDVRAFRYGAMEHGKRIGIKKLFY
jgi:ABC-2 type transport system permease protein